METENVVDAQMAYIKLVVRRLYDAQKLRIQSDLRVQRLEREGLILREDAERIFGKAQEFETKAEREYQTILWREIKDLEIVDGWLIRVRGIGPRLAGLLVGNISPISRFANISKLWAYCGLHVKDGRAARRQAGQKANWSAELKTTAWKIGQSFVKAGGPYRELYITYKNYLLTRETKAHHIIFRQVDGKYVPMNPPKDWDGEIPKSPEWTLGRINNMALRRTVKIFLSHLWLVWRQMENLPVTKPFVHEHLGHESIIDPWSMIEADAQDEVE